MATKGGWRRVGSRRHFRYEDARGRRITDAEQLERIRSLAIPPAWKDVWISPRRGAKLQATGVDAAGRKQYLYHPDFRAQQEQAKFDKLIRFAERLPGLRATMAAHLDDEQFSGEWTSAVALRLIDLGWFRVGSERYAKKHRTFGITTLKKSHATVRGTRVTFKYRGKQRAWVHTAIVDDELAAATRAPSPERLTSARPSSTSTWMAGRSTTSAPTIFRVVRARNIDLEPEEQALVSLLRSWRIRQSRVAA